MDDSLFLTVFQEFLVLTIKMCAPVLLVSIIVGLFVSIAQSITQIQEQTLTFVPKLFAGIITLIVVIPWMLQVFTTSVNAMFDYIPTFIR